MDGVRTRLVVVWLMVMLATLGGCAVQGQPVASEAASDSLAGLGIDPASYLILDVQRSGGLAGIDVRAQVYMDGHVVFTRGQDAPLAFTLTPAEQSQLQAALDGADFYRNAAQPQPDAPAIPDAFVYRIHRRGLMLQGEATVQEGNAPAWIAPLLPLLNQLLLQPDAGRLQPDAPTTVAFGAPHTATATPVAPPLILLEYVRSRPGDETRVLVSLDRSYSTAHNGQITQGELTREEMAALLQLLEAADLKSRGRNYRPQTACADCTTYQIIYRNVLGQAKASGESGSMPEWLEILTATLDEGFAAPELMADATATPSIPSGYGVQDLLADLADEGAVTAGPTGQVVKPYLSAAGVEVQIRGQAVQIFHYADAAALDADVASLAADASSINGQPLIWAAAPHFWRHGDLLVLLVSDDPVLVEMLRGVLGEPFAAR